MVFSCICLLGGSNARIARTLDTEVPKPANETDDFRRSRAKLLEAHATARSVT